MKQIISSCTVYNATVPDVTDLEDALHEARFVDLLDSQQLSIGFVPRVLGGDYVEKFTGGVSFTVRVDQKIVSSALVRSEADKLAKAIEASRGRKPGKKERKELKLAALDNLLAVTPGLTTNVITCFWHADTSMLIVPTTSRKLCDRIMSLLVNATGSVKTTTIHVSNVKQGLTKRLRDWLDGDDTAFNGLDPVNYVVLDQDKLRVSVKMGDLNSACAGLKEALAQGFTVKSLGFQTAAGTELRLSDDFKLNAIQFAHPPTLGEDEPEVFEAEATLEVAEIVDFVVFLCEMFGYEEPAAA